LKRAFLSRVGIVALLTIASIAIHEFGHFVVYRLAGYPVHITLQSVHAVGYVDPNLDRWAKVAGPALSLVAAAICLVVARRRPSFAWTTASFTNASLRLFPLAMDVSRAFKGAPAFSDEGEVALALTSAISGRLVLLAIPITVFLLLTALAAREYHFQRRGLLKSVGIYLFSLSIGVGVVIIDELLR
jgi:hypothetical protein